MTIQRTHPCPRLFIGNFDFEHRLADPGRDPPEKLNRFNAELASAWLAIAADGDLVWTPLAFDEEFWSETQLAGLPRVTPLYSLVEAPREVECVPWGWSVEVRRWSEQAGWQMMAPAAEAVSLANSRRTSASLETEWNCGLPGSRPVESLADVNQAIQSLGLEQRWVIKAEFGMSARERILGRGNPAESDVHWIERRLKQQGVVFIEPWVDRFGEVGLQFDVPRQGSPQFVGATPMVVDARGQYAGSWFSYRPLRFPAEQPLWDHAISVAMSAASRIQSLGYFGPLGIDAMVYRGENGLPQVRPLQDINARWTMGRLSLGWRRFLGPEEEGFWWHGAGESPSLPETLNYDRIIKTSPRTIGATECAHQSRIFIQQVARE